MKKTLLIAGAVVSGIAGALYLINKARKANKTGGQQTFKRPSHHRTNVFARAKNPTIAHPN